MAVWILGSINEDRFYRVARLPGPGETITAEGHTTGLGGKGANQSVAAARAGSTVHHIGRIGPGGEWTRDRLAALGVDVRHVSSGPTAMGHANVHVDVSGENMIVIYPGANREITESQIEAALAEAEAGDFVMIQNETNLTLETARLARAKGLFTVYSAAPFEALAAAAMLPFTDLLVLNEIEAAQLSGAAAIEDLAAVPRLLVTRGASGATLHDRVAGVTHEVGAFPVEPVDTTGAGDCYIGYVVAGLDQGLEPAQALRLAAAAAAIKVTRAGTADAIPERAEVEAFLSKNAS